MSENTTDPQATRAQGVLREMAALRRAWQGFQDHVPACLPILAEACGAAVSLGSPAAERAPLIGAFSLQVEAFTRMDLAMTAVWTSDIKAPPGSTVSKANGDRLVGVALVLLPGRGPEHAAYSWLFTAQGLSNVRPSGAQAADESHVMTRPEGARSLLRLAVAEALLAPGRALLPALRV